MPNPGSTQRREVHYGSIEQFRGDVERLAETGYHTVGLWTYPQILDHLARSFHASLDGFGFKAPWWARFFVAPLVKNSFLTKTMKPGFKLPRSALAIMPATGLTLSAAIDNLREAIDRYTRDPQRSEHPFLGRLAEQEWDSLHLRHSELHMSYVVPEEV